LESPENKKDFFPFAIHIINAAIIAFSFELVKDDFIPFNLIVTFSDKVNFIAVLFVWGFLISGWLGYTKSVKDKPHKEGIVGNLRFVTELVISFFMLYLFVIADKDKFASNFGTAFVWFIPMIFGLFIIWDLLKYREYNQESPEDLKRRMFYTVYTFFAILAQDLFYNLYSGTLIAGFSFDKNWTLLIFIGISSVIIGIYRVLKGSTEGANVKVEEG
jgi:hypothetical protein